MRDLFKKLVVGIVLLASPYVAAEQYKVLVIPDNIVSSKETVDSYIYNATSEFFANEVINLLNQTDYIYAPTVSEGRKILKENPAYMIPARDLANKFKSSYNVDFVQLKKLTVPAEARFALLITSTIDAENYVLRRTIWDFLNIPGATVIDPAYKICTYAVLIDTERNVVLWSNTFYKTISVVENRIITRGPSPQTEQLQKIRDYSRMLCPEIAQNVQREILPFEEYNNESKQIYYDMGNFDNVFTKKYRRWHKEGSKDYSKAKDRVETHVETVKDATKNKYDEIKQWQNEKKEERLYKKKLDVKAEPIKVQPVIENKNRQKNSIHNVNYQKRIKNNNQKHNLEDQSLFESFEIKKTRKNTLFGEEDNSRPPLRDYN